MTFHDMLVLVGVAGFVIGSTFIILAIDSWFNTDPQDSGGICQSHGKEERAQRIP
jgi:hypothetical protein